MKKEYGIVLRGLVGIGMIWFCSAEGWGADWRLYARSADGTEYYDTDNMTRPSKDVIRVWEKMIYSEKGVQGQVESLGEKFRKSAYRMTLNELNCAEKKVRVLSISEYSTDGEVLFSSDYQEPKWQFIVPESLAELLSKGVCN